MGKKEEELTQARKGKRRKLFTPSLILGQFEQRITAKKVERERETKRDKRPRPEKKLRKKKRKAEAQQPFVGAEGK